MARVIKEIPIKEKQVLCHNCGSTIAYVPNDVRESYDSDFGASYWLKCPACNKDIGLKSR